MTDMSIYESIYPALCFTLSLKSNVTLIDMVNK